MKKDDNKRLKRGFEAKVDKTNLEDRCRERSYWTWGKKL